MSAYSRLSSAADGWVGTWRDIENWVDQAGEVESLSSILAQTILAPPSAPTEERTESMEGPVSSIDCDYRSLSRVATAPAHSTRLMGTGSQNLCYASPFPYAQPSYDAGSTLPMGSEGAGVPDVLPDIRNALLQNYRNVPQYPQHWDSYSSDPFGGNAQQLRSYNNMPDVGPQHPNDENYYRGQHESLGSSIPHHLGARHMSPLSMLPRVPVAYNEAYRYRLVPLEAITVCIAPSMDVFCVLDTDFVLYPPEWHVQVPPQEDPHFALPVPMSYADSVVLPEMKQPSIANHVCMPQAEATPCADTNLLYQDTWEALPYQFHDMEIAAFETTGMLTQACSDLTSLRVEETAPCIDSSSIYQDTRDLLPREPNSIETAALETTEILNQACSNFSALDLGSAAGANTVPQDLPVLEAFPEGDMERSPGATTKICLWDSCGAHLTSPSVASVRKHFTEYHATVCSTGGGGGDALVVCRWEQCRTEMKRANYVKHVCGVHLRLMEVVCECCGSTLIRPDALRRHQEKACTPGSAVRRRIAKN
ncbi:uncharacterized protein FIBRA_06515 [Fibroporia radiculosa]|uniref:C2H2-type domain-containing protein n=1 Tax=Fibroporia radiculosa TaxID=599839 RepID=J4GBQ5_9APHY|nr:uncharacterized protein FIBRA_06515 [Fibroporia radiculosa]CCM04343.1 predicted protein [Fibroporia radiculosa]